MDWLGILFLMFTCLLVVDLFTLFGFGFRHYVPALRGAALAAGLVLSAIALVQAARTPYVHEYEIKMAGLPAEDDGLVVAVISDLHVGALIGEDWLAERVAQVNAMRPDLVAVLGDVVEGDDVNDGNARVVSLLRSISAPLGVWAVTGNHEGHGGVREGISFYDECGFQSLHNEWAEVRPGLAIGGVDDGGHGMSAGGSVERIKQTLAAKPSGEATLFLSHRPMGAEEAAKAGVGLMLAGHTHGGQIWPFTYISGLANPLLVGKYDIDGMPVIVSRGMGTWGPRMRLWSRGEILRITLRGK